MIRQPQPSPPRIEPQSDKVGRALLSLAFASAAFGLVFWLVGLVSPQQSVGTVREGAVGLSFLLAGGSVYLWGRHAALGQRQALRYFQQLGEMDLGARLGDSSLEGIPLPPTNPWFFIARQFADRFDASDERLREAEQALTALEVRQRRFASRQQQVEILLANLPEPVMAVNSFDELVLINSAAENLFALSEKSAVGQPLARVLHCERLVELLLETRRRRAPAQRSGEVELLDESGNSRWYGIVAKSFVSDDKSAPNDCPSVGAFAVLRDISELKSGQKRYAEFVSAVSHEMKSPLSGIKAYVELLADCDAADSAHREEFLGVIDGQANRLQRLIDNLLNIARIEAGVVAVSKISISLNELLAEALEIVRPAAEAKRIRLSAEFSPMYLGALADRDMLMQAAINLLSNAIKYTPDGGSVVLRSRMTHDEVEFEVDDTGVGLDKEDAVRVFEKFYRVAKDRGMAQGTGLGLSLAKHIVEDVHGGRITVESTPGAGSVFRVSLPAAAQLVS
jgi:two-component system phosphate regulon sensor histidine kinase PhoR